MPPAQSELPGRQSLRDITNDSSGKPKRQSAAQKALLEVLRRNPPVTAPSKKSQPPVKADSSSSIKVEPPAPIPIPPRKAPRRELTSEHLKYFALEDTWPFPEEEHHWLDQFHFNELHHRMDMIDLLRVYKNLFKPCGALTKDVHAWRCQGILGDMICELFLKHWEEIDKDAYEFAFKNRFFINGISPPKERPDANRDIPYTRVPGKVTAERRLPPNSKLKPDFDPRCLSPPPPPGRRNSPEAVPDISNMSPHISKFPWL
ncbi:uncharacterized protein E0L32_005166 [Thyridium curvatum]|uniref:Uncharacterized protein n=1 Tax=Thyridium curvatum TaxID=1093900 RepID=A0A507BCT6_9PEZI|nr:uncharacterized protein E0L32_005166 [Thyridium curvatum]TPX14771.1 hypothetical protein E0L32_005166 [Thyridium curvatum]